MFFFNLPQNRHPERSASQICRVPQRLSGAESKDPKDAYPTRALRPLSTTAARTCRAMKRCTRDHQVRTAGRILLSGLGGQKTPNSIDKIGIVGVPSATLGTGSSTPRHQGLGHAIDLLRAPLRVCDFFISRCRLRPESSQEHLPGSIAGVLRLRAINPLFSIDLRSASLRMTTLLGGLQYSWLDSKKHEGSKTSQALRMTISW